MKTILQKGLLPAFLLLMLVSSSFAQSYLQNPKYGENEEARRECAINLSLYREYYNQKAYDAAKPAWQKVLQICPAASQNAYIHGARMLKTWIEEESNPNRRAELIDSLMMVYDMRMEHFDRKGALYGQKGMDLMTLNSDRYEEAYEFLKKSVEIEQDATDSPVIYTYMLVTKTMYDNDKISAEKVIETYAQLIDYLDVQLSERPDNSRLLQIKDMVESTFTSAGVADCENLTALFQPRIEKKPNDVELIKKTYSLLGANKCDGTDFYTDVAVKLFDNKPTSTLAYEIAKIFKDQKEYKKSEEYFKHAIELEENTTKKSVYLVEYAEIVFDEFKKSQQARSLALQALEVNPGMGHAHILIGNIYASEEDCFSDEFKKKTVYWAAVDQFAKAKQADPSLASEADRLIGVYSQYFPAQNDIFFQDLSPGERYTVGCWINESTTVRQRP